MWLAFMQGADGLMDDVIISCKGVQHKMFRFSKEQSVVNIAGVRVGGQKGELPSVLAGTIFYHGHHVVYDEMSGEFDRNEAAKLIAAQAEASEETGNPSMLHVFARTQKAFEKYLDFLDGRWDGPLILDSPMASIRLRMAMLVSEVGYADRSVYNSINKAFTKEEAAVLSDTEIDSAILLAFNPSRPGVEGRIGILEGSDGSTGLIKAAMSIGVRNILIDPGVTPIGSGAGEALRFITVAKARLGLPVGAGMHNAASSWRWLANKDAKTRLSCDVAASAVQLIAGADFVLYGPIENARHVFPAAAMVDIMIKEAALDLGAGSIPGHPANRLV
jgi:tetrahydromethanopterin S-methyltransferase subunit H